MRWDSVEERFLDAMQNDGRNADFSQMDRARTFQSCQFNTPCTEKAADTAGKSRIARAYEQPTETGVK